MKLKHTRKPRTCSACASLIQKGELYSQRSQTVLFDKEGQSLNGGRTWEPLRLTKKVDFCKDCTP